jgi:hypothetical protein
MKLSIAMQSSTFGNITNKNNCQQEYQMGVDGSNNLQWFAITIDNVILYLFLSFLHHHLL